MTWLQMPALARGGKQKTIDRIVIHATVSPCKPGGARANARWFANPKAMVSAHYVVDPVEIVQCLPDDIIGYHAPPNRYSLGVELCDMQSGPASRWQDKNHTAMLTRAAGLVAHLCAVHDLPVTFLGQSEVANARGITTHAVISKTFRQSTHTDPGPDFPLEDFMALVRQAAKPAPTEEEPLSPEQLAELKAHITDGLESVYERLHNDARILLRGDETHPANLESIFKAVQK